MDWDDPAPRFRSLYDSENADKDPLLQKQSLTYFGRYVYENQAQCTVQTCWDLSRCSALISNRTLTVYLNNTDISHFHPKDTPTEPRNHFPSGIEAIQYASENAETIKVKLVTDSTKACLVLVTASTYASADELYISDHWSNNGKSPLGQNHLLWNLKEFPYYRERLSGDAPFFLFHTGYAMIASESLSMGYMRVGYDMPLALSRRWERPTPDVDLHRPRKWLLSFRGKIVDRWNAYYQHRWLAAEYWEDADDVFLDVQCARTYLFGLKKKTYRRYDNFPSIYDDLMWNSVFGFAPGGSGPSSFRLSEILSTGTIPVVVAGDYVPPLAPEMDWSKCLVYVSENHIIDLPRRLRLMSQEEIHQRREACWRLLKSVVGDRPVMKGGKQVWIHDARVQFTKALEIIAARVFSAFHTKELAKSLNE